MVTAGNGVLTFVGASGRVYSLSFYSSDVIGAYVTISTSGLAVAGSQTFWNTPENLTLTDVSFTSTNTVSTAWLPQVNDVSIGNVISIANSLNTLAFRSVPRISISAGRKFTMVQA